MFGSALHMGPILCTVGRVSAFGAGGRGFESRPHHTKGVNSGTSSSLSDARIKGVVLGRYSKAGKRVWMGYND